MIPNAAFGMQMEDEMEGSFQFLCTCSAFGKTFGTVARWKIKFLFSFFFVRISSTGLVMEKRSRERKSAEGNERGFIHAGLALVCSCQSLSVFVLYVLCSSVSELSVCFSSFARSPATNTISPPTSTSFGESKKFEQILSISSRQCSVFLSSRLPFVTPTMRVIDDDN